MNAGVAMEPSVIRLAQVLAELVGGPRDVSPATIASCRYVTVALAATMTGFTEKAIRRKIEDGVWIENLQYKRAPDGHVMIDIQGVESWVEKAAGSKSAKAASA